MLTLLQNLTTTLENIIKLDEGDQKSFELALLSKNIMDMERGPEVLLITAILTEEHNSKPRHSVAFSGVFFEQTMPLWLRLNYYTPNMWGHRLLGSNGYHIK